MADTNNNCLTNYSKILINEDNSVSVFLSNTYGYYPVQLTLVCCKALNPTYYFDLDTQKCFTEKPITCGFNNPINLIVNPDRENGVEFFVEEFESGTCGLKISFDYLLKIKCETLLNIINPTVTTNKLNDENLQQINISQQNIEDLNTQIETKTDTIILLQEQILVTPYSIECSTFPTTTPNQSTTNNTGDNFNNTAFNTTNSNAQLDNTTTTTYSPVKYCLTDYGLTVWKNILGPTNYTQFLLGDISNPGYTCNDVIKIATQTWPNGVAINTCETNFGDKSALLVDLNEEMSLLTSLKLDLTNEQNKLIETIAIGNSDCLTPTQALEALDIEMHLNVVNDTNNTLTSVFSAATFPAINLTSNLYEYLTTGGDSGFYICGDPSNTDIGLSDCTILSIDNGLEETPNVSSCDLLLDELLNELFDESGLAASEQSTFLPTLPKNAFASNWLSYSTVITDPNIINLITNKKIKISFKINYSCIDFCLLLDNIVLDKSCKTLEKNDIITISKNPGFDLTRIVDNKKSWVDTTSLTNREFLVAKSDGTNPVRQTNYNINDERLVINSKEIDLDISIASAIETDVWCYLNDNYGLLTGITTCNNCENTDNDFNKEFQDDRCFVFMDNLPYNFMDSNVSDNNDLLCSGDGNVDFTKLITTDLSTVKSISNFENFMVSELIDAKNRQTISSYGTLRAIYERYLASANYVNTTSSAFDYVTMDKFSNLIGNYWVDIIEQVIPSTAIWGSVKIYTNTIFDEQKFKYKEYTSLFCDDSFSGLNKTNKVRGLICGSGEDVNVLIADLLSNNTAFKPKLVYDKKCDSVYLAQMNAGSEFIGNVTLPI
jgi:hypothetical protein